MRGFLLRQCRRFCLGRRHRLRLGFRFFFFRYFFGSFSFLLRQCRRFCFCRRLRLGFRFSSSVTSSVPSLFCFANAAAFALAPPRLRLGFRFSSSVTSSVPSLFCFANAAAFAFAVAAAFALAFAFLLPLLLLFLLFSASLTPPLLLLQRCTSFCFFYSNIVFLVALSLFLIFFLKLTYFRLVFRYKAFSRFFFCTPSRFFFSSSKSLFGLLIYSSPASRSLLRNEFFF